MIYTPRYSGAEILVRALTVLHQQNGVSSAVVALNPCEESFRSEIDAQQALGIPWIAPSKQLTRRERHKWIRHQLEFLKSDIVFAHSVIPAFYARLASRQPTVFVHHSAVELCWWRYRFIELLLRKRTSGVVSVSEVVRQTYPRREFGPLEALIPNGINIQAFEFNPPRRQEIRERLSIPADQPVALQAGRLLPVKGQHHSIRIWRNVLREVPGALLLLAGPTEQASYEEELHQAVREEGLSGQVRFLGPRSDISDLLACADLYLLPSSREAQSIGMIEALASGIQLVTSSTPGLSWGQAFAGVISIDPTQKHQYSQAVIQSLRSKRRFDRQVEQFDVSQTANQYLVFAQQILKAA